MGHPFFSGRVVFPRSQKRDLGTRRSVRALWSRGLHTNWFAIIARKLAILAGMEYTASMAARSSAAMRTVKEVQSGQQRHRSTKARGIDVAGLNFVDVPKLIGTLSRGLSWPQFDRFRKESGFTQTELAAFLGIPERTLARRRENGALTESESERFARLVEIFNACIELFGGNSEAVREWLTAPAYGLKNARPIDFTRSDYGAREVRNLLGRLADGIFS